MSTHRTIGDVLFRLIIWLEGPGFPLFALICVLGASFAMGGAIEMRMI